MKRIDKIYNYIIENSAKLTAKDIKEGAGFSAENISQALDILRNNVSKELNTLSREKKIIKIKGRPVLYLDKEGFQDLLGYELEDESIEIENIDEILEIGKMDEKEAKNPFTFLIGSDSGLKNQIEQAKAAIMYPPNGLHTLIVGETGVGKTLFASMMYNYSKFTKAFTEDAPFIVFNCADYYNNPQLLISQIFGHAKGAFTGADTEKDGLVVKANNGILFLDEIHRLPPEGQEMIFYFIDTGTYNKLGDTDRKRSAKVLIIGATTEEPGSFLLKTFMRRIPITISIPNLEDRPIKDRLDIVRFLLSKEANRVNKSIKLESDVVKALIGSASYGNVGQIKSNIQLVCAKGFLNSIDKSDNIEITFNSLPTEVKNGLFSLAGKRKEVEELDKYLDKELVIMPAGSDKELAMMPCGIEVDKYEPPFNLYKIIEDKSTLLKCEGVDEDFIREYITTDINIHIKSFYTKFTKNESSRENILKIVDEDILNFCEEIKRFIEEKKNKKLDDRFLYALSLHLSAFLKRMEKHTALNYIDIENIIKKNKEDFDIAMNIKGIIEERYKLIVPEMEVVYLTLLISAINEEIGAEHVAILVAMHGVSVASGMVNVTKKLLGEGIVDAIDMPLEVSPKKILDEMIIKVQEIDRGKGVLLLVDMGSLSSFAPVIIEKTGINIRCIDMVSTPLVLEAVRKTSRLDMDLNTIYETLKDFRGYARLESSVDIVSNKPRAIITICSTGEGTAKKLKEIVNNIIVSLTDEEIEIIPIGVKDVTNRVKLIQQEKNIIATVGIVNPNIEAPFISLVALIDGNGERILASIVKNNGFVTKESNTKVVVKDLCTDTLKQFLTYLNPFKIVDVLMKFIEIVSKELNITFDNSMCIKLIIHIGCAVERMLIKNGLRYEENIESLDKNRIRALKMGNDFIKKSINIELTDDEIYFIVEIME
ncbi:sigma 54-interacting transcriptional regulator [Clostridium vincentii]|nr:sigma-54-dependent transcriptional regulator [Clostridium vincentii]